MQTLKLNQNELDALKKFLNSVISSKTVPSLSSILQENFNYELESSKEIEFTELEEILPPFEDMITMSGIYISCVGDVKLGVLFYLPESEGRRLASRLLGTDLMAHLSKIGISSLTEIGNILAASIFNGVCELTGCKTESSVPGYAATSYRSLMECPIMEMMGFSSSIVLSNFEFRGEETELRLRLLLFQEPQETRKILDTL